jgi:hypothetical protein
MKRVYVFSADESARIALRLALSSLASIDAQDAETLTEDPFDTRFAFVLNCGHTRDAHGDLADFYLLRRLLWDSAHKTVGPIAVIGIGDWLFGSWDQRIPDAELVRYFAIPFNIVDLVSFVSLAEQSEDRRMTRLFLRGKLTDDDLAALTRGDRHGIRHFSTLMLRVEEALANDRPEMLGGKQDPHGVGYMAQVWAAEAMVACARSLPVRENFRSDANEFLSDLTRAVDYFRTLAVLIDGLSQGDERAHAQPVDVMAEIRRLAQPSVREVHEIWCCNWERLARRLTMECSRREDIVSVRRDAKY